MTQQSVWWLLTVGFSVPWSTSRTTSIWVRRCTGSSAQALLEDKLADAIVVQPFSWRWFADTARRCNLYDFKARRRTDFAGRRSAAVEASVA